MLNVGCQAFNLHCNVKHNRQRGHAHVEWHRDKALSLKDRRVPLLSNLPTMMSSH